MNNNRPGNLFKNREIALALLISCIVFSLFDIRFLSSRNIYNIFQQFSCHALLSLGMFFVILIGGIDLSVGSIMALSIVIMGKYVIGNGGNPYIGIILCMLSGSFLGFLNGLLLTKLNISHPFVVTLGTQNAYRSACFLLTSSVAIANFPSEIVFWGGRSIFAYMPISTLVVLITYILFSLFLRFSIWGRQMYAVGGNEYVAQMSGVDVKLIKIISFTISGFLSGIAGLILVGRVNAAYPLAGLFWETEAITAVIIGGTSFSGGNGNPLNVLLGALFIAVIRNGLIILNIASEWQLVIMGISIIISVYMEKNNNYSINKSAFKG